MNLKEFYEIYWKRGGYALKVYAYPEFKKAYINNIGLSNKRILDIGCGDGKFSALLLGNNNYVFGLDISEEAVKLAREKGIKAECFDIGQRFPFDDGSFDAVLLFDTLEHVFDPCFVLKESNRVLKEDGVLYCGLPNAAMIINRIRFLLTGNFTDFSAISDKFIPELFFAEHIRFFSPKIIKTLLKQCNFTIKKIEYRFPDYFENPVYNKFSWIAKTIVILKLHKLFPGLIAFNMFIEAVKD